MLKKLISFAAASIFSICAAATVSALGTSDAYYVTFDEFTAMNNDNKEVNTVSSYDTYTLGGTVNIDTLNDSSDLAGVITKRDFNKTYGKILWEMCVTAPTVSEGSSINLRCGDTDAVKLQGIDGKLTIVTPKRNIPLNSESGFYGVSALVDIDAGTYSIRVNGVTVGTDLEMLNKVDYLDNFFVETLKEETGRYTFSAMRISKGYSINEWFLTSRTQIPDDWKVIGKGVKLAALNSSIQNDKYSLLIEDGDFLSESGVSHELDYDTDDLWFEFQFLAPDKVKEFGASLQSGGDEIIKIGFRGLDYGYWLDGKFVPAYTMKKNLWYHAMVKLTEDGAKVYINHKLVADNVPAERKKIDNVKLAVGKTATGSVYIDDIVAKAMHPLPEDYVPEPVIPKKTSDVLIGMQSCDIWREGTHFGWDAISAYDERRPYVGFYEDGSSEEKDWETKWMTEHGVDYEIYCWYRQPEGKGSQIKRPRNAFALHEGYFNSEYSDKIKFAIAWENGNLGCSGPDDFENNVIPYWMEQYFKDDRYLKIDNKPVLCFYSVNGLIRDFGTYDAIKAEVEFLDAACREEGFDGIYLLMTSGSANAATLEDIKYIGVDTLYAYSWSEGSVDPEVQKNFMIAQRNTGIIDMMPTIGMGRDDAPWERKRGGFMEIDKFKSLLEWTRDEFLPSLDPNGHGRKMLMLDNWNEYGEGHFMMPSNLHGFGYLDAVREVFTENTAHEDEVPTEAAKERFNHLYVQNRVKSKTFAQTQYDKQLLSEAAELKVMRGYYFDGEDVSKYPIVKQVESYEIKDGILSGVATDRDPGFYIKDINEPTANIKTIRVRFKSSVTGNRFQIFYITDASNNWQEVKSVTTYPSDCKDFIEFDIDVSSAAQWSGTLLELRVDPIETGGESFAFDYIELLGIENEIKLYIDGEAQIPAREIQIIDGTMYVPTAEYAASFEFKYSDTIDGKYLEMINEEGVFYRFEYGVDAIKVDNQSYFPLRKVAEGFGAKIVWNQELGCAEVITSEQVVTYAPDPPGTYNFNRNGDTQGLQNFANMGDIKVSRGILRFNAITNDSNLRLTLNTSASTYSYCNIRMKNGSDGKTLKVYFNTSEDSRTNEAKSVSTGLMDSTAGFVNYSLDMASNPSWKGSIREVRFDFTDGMGDMQIDYIILSKSPITESSAAETSYGDNILHGGIMDSKELVYKAQGLTAQTSDEDCYLGRYSLKLKSDKADAYVQLPTNISKGNMYHFSAWAKTKDVSDLTVGTYNADGGLNPAAKAEVTVFGDWANISANFTAEAAASGIYLAPTVGTIYLDILKLNETVVKGGNEEEEVKKTPQFKERKGKKSGPVKVLIIGNSITQHNASEGIGWLGTWGMAATSAENDYVHQLQSMAKAKNSKVEFRWRNISDFEKYFFNFDAFNSGAFQEYVDYDADIIICTAGANIKNPANENDPGFATHERFDKEQYANIVNFFNPYGDAKVIIGLTTLTNRGVTEIITEAAEDNKWALVDMSDLTDAKYTAVNYKDAEVFTDKVTNGVMNHPGDEGMKVMAERLWQALEPVMAEVKR